MSEPVRVRDKASWRDALLRVLKAWNRHQVWKILTAIVVIWIVSGTALHFAERGTNPAFETLARVPLERLGHPLQRTRQRAQLCCLGGSSLSAVLVVGVALAGLFTASVASILIERSLRSREVSNLEMSDHLVLCNWSPRALDWIREVHSGIVTDKRPVVIVHDTPDEVVLPDKQDDAAFNDVYIVKGDPANEVILRRAKVAQAHSVVILSDDRQDAARRRKNHRVLHCRQERVRARAPAEHRGRVPGSEIPVAHAQGGCR